MQKMGAKNFPPLATGILVNFERRWLGMMTKMKKLNVLIYQVTRFARDNKLPQKISYSLGIYGSNQIHTDTFWWHSKSWVF